MSRKKARRIVQARMAGENHRVVTVVGSSDYQRQPCAECPWRKANVGSFPAEAFRHSAITAHDMAQTTFACHMKGVDRSSVCAGFLLFGADDNLSVRMARAKRRMMDVRGNAEELFATYRLMAEANGVPPDDPALEHCMPEARQRRKM